MVIYYGAACTRETMRFVVTLGNISPLEINAREIHFIEDDGIPKAS